MDYALIALLVKPLLTKPPLATSAEVVNTLFLVPLLVQIVQLASPKAVVEQPVAPRAVRAPTARLVPALAQTVQQVITSPVQGWVRVKVVLKVGSPTVAEPRCVSNAVQIRTR